jgi:cytochrome P450
LEYSVVDAQSPEGAGKHKSVSLFDPGESGANPPEFARRQSEAPLAPLTLPSGDNAWLAVRYADVKQVLSDTSHFSRDLSRPGVPRMTAGYDPRREESFFFAMDPPEHTRLRRLITKPFTAQNAQVWRPRAEEIADELINNLLTLPPPVDLIPAYAHQVSIRIICEVLGIPAEHHEQVRIWSDSIMSRGNESADANANAFREFHAYACQLVDKLRATPQDSLTDELIKARDDEDRLTESELTRTVVLMIIAGHLTTSTVIARGIYALLAHRGAYEALVLDPGLMDRAVEEVLRTQPATLGVRMYIAKDDVALPSGIIPRCGAVVAPVAAANQDPAVFDEPEKFDIHREYNPHLAFGHGSHFCPGAALARMELQVAFGKLTRRLPGLRLAVDADTIPWAGGHHPSPARIPAFLE